MPSDIIEEISSWQMDKGVLHLGARCWKSFIGTYTHTQASHVVLVVKDTSANVGDVRGTGLIPGSGRSPGGGHGNPL